MRTQNLTTKTGGRVKEEIVNIKTVLDKKNRILSIITSLVRTVFKDYVILKPKTIPITSVYNVVTAVVKAYRLGDKVISKETVPTRYTKFLSTRTGAPVWGKPQTMTLEEYRRKYGARGTRVTSKAAGGRRQREPQPV